MPFTRDPVDHLSRIHLLTELLKRASTRIQIVGNPNDVEYLKTIAEIRLIMARINELIVSI